MAYYPQYSYPSQYPQASSACPAQGCTAEDLCTLRVEGRGSVTAQPDRAEVYLGVTTENTSLTTAQAENAAAITAVINALTRLGIPAQDIATQSYTISPQYDYVDNKQVFRNYRVQHTLKVTIRDTNRVGQIIDAAVASGANFVNDINFTISDPSLYYQQALTLAIDDAVAKALAIGTRLKINVAPIPIRIIETTYGPAPIQPLALKAAAPSTPIQVGQLEITAQVEVTFTYS